MPHMRPACCCQHLTVLWVDHPVGAGVHLRGHAGRQGHARLPVRQRQGATSANSFASLGSTWSGLGHFRFDIWTWRGCWLRPSCARATAILLCRAQGGSSQYCIGRVQYCTALSYLYDGLDAAQLISQPLLTRRCANPANVHFRKTELTPASIYWLIGMHMINCMAGHRPSLHLRLPAFRTELLCCPGFVSLLM